MQLPQSVMIVEDEMITQRHLEDILRYLGISDIEGYVSGKEARAAFSKRDFDMVLMDINLEGQMDGIQLAGEFLQKRKVPIIFITAHSDEDTMQEVLDLAPYGFVPKPFSAKNVEAVLKVAYNQFLTQASQKEGSAESDELAILSPRYKYSKTLKQLYVDDEPVQLNPKISILIDTLCNNLGTTVSYDQLNFEIWGDEPIASSALRTLVYMLRKQFPDFPIVSHSRVGYLIKPEV